MTRVLPEKIWIVLTELGNLGYVRTEEAAQLELEEGSIVVQVDFEKRTACDMYSEAPLMELPNNEET